MKTALITCCFVILISCQKAPQDSTPDQNEPVSACTKDLKICPDGQSVGRDVNNQCEFFTCPEELEVTAACPDDVKQCADGSFAARDINKGCAFKPCPSLQSSNPEPLLCTQDVKQCADGSYVGRDSMNNCAFKPCSSGDGQQLK